jgi:DNA-binding CsgD family transcriptional regulator
VICQRTTDNPALTEAIHALRLDDPDNVSARRGIARIHKTDGSAITVHVSAIRPEQAMGAFGHMARALLIFHDPKISVELDPFIVAETFDLSPAEARVAVQLAAGKTAQQIAEESFVALSTIRTQVQTLFQKTGVTRQVDLIRLLSGLPR